MKRQPTNKRFFRTILFIFFFLISACGAVHQNDKEESTQGDEDAIRVAAVGDSITAEYSSDTGYPAKLNDLLGDDYLVENFGASNYAAQSSSDFPYETTDAYQESLEFKPNIVLIMLGTNDTKSTNWQSSEAFKKEYTNLLENYLNLKSVSRVILASPPTVFLETVFEGSIDPEIIHPIRNTIKDIASEHDLEFVDMTKQTMDHPEWFFDGLHPNAEGAEEIARIFYQQMNQ